MYLYISDLNGDNTEALTGYKVLKRKRILSGEKTIGFVIFPTEQNTHSYNMVQEESIVEFKGETYRIKQMSERNKGKVIYKEVTAIHTFFDLIDEFVYETYTGSMTFEAALQFVFNGLGYTWDIIGTFTAKDFENFGNSNPVDLFNDLRKRYGFEFTLNGKHFTFKHKIGNATDFQFRYNYNIKAITRSVDTSNLSTYIKGFGEQNEDGTYAVQSEYTSPKSSIFGIRHAKPVYDKRYTTIEGLNERLVSEIIDIPVVSITIDFNDMRRAGFPYDVPNEGDDVFLIFEPMNNLDIETRIMEVDEEFVEFSEYPIKTNVTISNYRNKMSDKFIDFSKTEKEVTDIIEGNTQLPYSVVDPAIRRATEAIQSAQTEVEFENGITLRSKDDPNFLVRLTSVGIAVSTDNGATFRTAMTAEGFVADLVTVGTMLADRLKGGTLTLGGVDNGNGKMVVLNSEGEIIADLDAIRGGFDNLYVGNLKSPTVENINKFNYNLYVDPINGNDNNPGNTYWTNPKKTIMSAINSIPKMNYGVVKIYVHYDNGRNIYENLTIEGFVGAGDIVIDFQTQENKLIGTIWVRGCTNNIQLMNGTVNTDSTTSAAIRGDRCQYVSLFDMRVFGNNKAYAAYVFAGGTTGYMWHCQGWNTTDIVRSESVSRVAIADCDGLGELTGLVAVESGIIRGYGSAPAGKAQNIYEANGGDVISEFTFPSTPIPPTPPPPPETTKQIGTNSGNNWSESGYWSNDGVKQGNYGYGNRRGCWFFGTSILDNIGSGKTIKSMKVYISRDSRGGSSSSQRHSLRAHGHTSQPGGAPSLSGEIGSINLGWGQAGWINVDPSVYGSFANGGYRGFGLYTGGDNYSICSVSCTVEITYQ